MKKKVLLRKLALLAAVVLCGTLLPAGCSDEAGRGVRIHRPVNGASATLLCSEAPSRDGVFMLGESPLTVRSENMPTEKFNRVEFGYTCSAPLLGTMRYRVGGRDVSEDFYLSDTQKNFSLLIGEYLDKKQAEGPVEFSFSPLHEGGSFTLDSIAFSSLDVCEPIVYLENSRFRAGVDLEQGGGLSYFEDLQCPNEAYGNLLNCHDTGRLAQQSYYGTIEDPAYTPARYNDAVWNYNPVQGGDQYGNQSRLIDVSVTDMSITVVSLPLDWAQSNTETFAYYTNTYTLGDDGLRVDNEVLDFSGYDNPARVQELPAFYTVSALNRFTFYDGEAPWTGAALRTEENLPFWGGDENCCFALSPANTETWCAFTDGEDYGIGLFTPGVETLCAGRYRYSEPATPDPMADATNYFAPLATLSLLYDRPICYSYLVTAGTLSEIRKTFSENRDFCRNTDLRQSLDESYTFADMHFADEEDRAYFADVQQTELSFSNGCAVLRATQTKDSDPFVLFRYDRSAEPISADEYPFLVLTYRVDPAASKLAEKTELFLGSDRQRQAKAGCSAVYELEADGKWHTLTASLGSLSFWHGQANFIRFDYFTKAQEGDTLYLYSAVLAKSAEEAKAAAAREEKLARENGN